MARPNLPEVIEQLLDEVVGGGFASTDEADAALQFFDELADRELAGDISPEAALQEAESFAVQQMQSRRAVKS